MKTIKWGVQKGSRNPFSDPRLSNLDRLVVQFRRGQMPTRWRGNRVFENRGPGRRLPTRAHNYYREFYVGNPRESGSLRVVLGRGGETYVTGSHYWDWIQVLHLPFFQGFSPIGKK